MNAFGNASPLSKILYLFVFCLAGLFLAGSLVTVINGFVGGQLMLSPWGVRLSSAIQMVLMFFMPAITLITWSGNKPIVFLGLQSSRDSLVLYLLAFAILLGGMPFITLISELNQMLVLPQWLSGLELWMKNLEESAQVTTNLLLEGTSIWDLLGNILFIGVFAAVAEEVFFRGALQQLLGKLFKNKHLAVWVTAFIFSLLHMQFYGFLPRIILGAVLGYLFVYSKNLWIPIFVHFLNNALVVIFNFFFRENSVYQYLEHPAITLTFLVAGLVSLGLLVYLFWLFKAKVCKQVER
ncbi:MAG: CPBP family intramembrane metalloprotease [Bacteroidales bacterium]|nr:CPBP family intramembrane metalloprotease [Bacteroidales bacterium]